MQLLRSFEGWQAGPTWLVFFGLVLAGWAALFGLAAGHAVPALPGGGGLGALDPAYSSALWRALCSAVPASQSLAGLTAMWSLMAVAMMAPTAVPLLHSYAGLGASQPQALGRRAFWALAGGYVLVWLGYAVLAALLQRQLTALDLLTDHGVSLSRWLTVLLLALAGLYQFTALKAACLSKCRSPLAFFFTSWRDGVTGAFRMGLEHGLICLGCCWALMALAFVGGTMNLAWMGAAMLLMIVEKLPALGRFVTRPLGVLLLASALYAALRDAPL